MSIYIHDMRAFLLLSFHTFRRNLDASSRLEQDNTTINMSLEAESAIHHVHSEESAQACSKVPHLLLGTMSAKAGKDSLNLQGPNCLIVIQM